MVIDTSALAAIFFHEPERDAFRNAIVAASSRLISAATVLEAGMVIEGRRGGGGAGREFDLFLVRTRIKIVPIDAELADLARSAWRKYAKGRHPAGLNFGDCFSYALAKSSGEPLLAKGTDFAKTDVALHS